MKRPTPPDPFAAYVECWRQWTSVVEKFARRRKARHKVSDADYTKLRKELIDATARFEDAENEAQRVFAGHVRQIVKPWVAVDAFRNEQMHALFALLARCADVERMMVAKNSRINPARWSTGLIASVAVVALAALVLGWLAFHPNTVEAMSSGMRGTFIKISNTIRWSSFIERFSVVTIVFVLIGIRLAMRTARA